MILMTQLKYYLESEELINPFIWMWQKLFTPSEYADVASQTGTIAAVVILHLSFRSDTEP